MSSTRKGRHVTANDRLKLVRGVYGAYASGDRQVVERSLADDFIFSAPPDVVAKPAAVGPGGLVGHETEIFGFDGNKISRVEVYFGWDVE
jgi:hypothetical protein